MEIAIRVVVVLFVAVVAGSLIIMFARETIDSASLNMKSLNVEDNKYILELTNTDADTINKLIEQCHKDKDGYVAERELCYVVHADINFNPGDLGSFPFQVDGNFVSGNNALFIYYNIFNDGIEVNR